MSDIELLVYFSRRDLPAVLKMLQSLAAAEAKQ